MRTPFGCIRGCVVVVAALYIAITVISVLARGGSVGAVQLVLLGAAALVVVGIALFGHSGHWTG